jgi:tetratricopeptide (TPR) repeat protein
MPLTKLRLWAALASFAFASPGLAQMSGGMTPTPSVPEVDPAIPYQNGIAAFNAGDYVKAIRELRAARDASSGDGVINYALGRAYAASGKKKEAKQAFQSAVRARNAPIPAYLQLGLVAIDLGDRTTAANQLAALDKKLVACGVTCSETARGQIKAAMDQLARALAAP